MSRPKRIRHCAGSELAPIGGGEDHSCGPASLLSFLEYCSAHLVVYLLEEEYFPACIASRRALGVGGGLRVRFLSAVLVMFNYVNFGAIRTAVAV